MLLYLLAYLGGALTILSPCILPVLPFVLARSDRPFVRSGLPMLAGMALMFVAVASLAAVGGGWVVRANQIGRTAALVVLALFGVSMLFPGLGDRAMRPLVGLGARLSDRARGGGGIGAALLLGVATGLLWAPCAGPILGLVLTGAALNGASASTSLLLLAYALGAATSLAAALLFGGRVFRAMTRSLGLGQWVRRAVGAAVIAAVAAIALGMDTGFLTALSASGTNRIEQALLDRFGMTPPARPHGADEGAMPPLDGAVAWINSPPLTRAQLRGKVVLVDFWTYSCINCLRSLPYVQAWANRYGPAGLVVIGVHTPEFAFERDPANVRRAVHDLGITYPVAIDNDTAIWRAFANNYWPAHYFIDATGRIRAHAFGEGDYAASEQVIRRLLAEAHPGLRLPAAGADPAAHGAEMQASSDIASDETYIGYDRAAGSVARPAAVHDALAVYATHLAARNDWGLIGRWTVGAEAARLEAPGGRIVYRFHARDLHLVAGAPHPVRFRVTVDGHAPGADHGMDTDAAGNGVISAQRLYQLVRLAHPGADHDVSIEFLDPGVEAFSFTFG